MNNYIKDNAVYLLVNADVRYWEDGTVNGEEDGDGSLIPLRQPDTNLWCPMIELQTGKILGWPEGVTADVHYKVCDAGKYYLLDGYQKVICRYTGDYVPDRLLYIDDNNHSGYGDYICLKIDSLGYIKNWEKAIKQYDFSDGYWEKINPNA